MTQAELRATIPRLTAKLNEDNFTDALKIAEGNKKLSLQLTPIRAYISYRLGEYQRVIELYNTLHQNAQRELGVLHLMAQTHYKMGLKSGDFKTACAFYNEIAEKFPAHAFSSAEYIVNALAAYINAGDVFASNKLLQSIQFDSSTSSATNPSLFTYEALFNISFASLQSNQLDNALQHAESAYKQFQTSLDQDDQDISEAALLQYHIAYIRYLQAQSPQSATQFFSTNANLTTQLNDFSGAIQSILQLNSVIFNFQSASTTAISIKNNEKPTDLAEQLRVLQKQYHDKLSRFQLAIIQYNLATFSSLQKSADKGQLNKLVQSLPTQKLTNEPGMKPLYQQASAQSLVIVNPHSGSPIHKDWLLLTLSLYSLVKDKEFSKLEEQFATFFTNLTPLLSTQPQLVEYYTNAKLSQIFVEISRHNLTAAISYLQAFVQDFLIQSYLHSTKQLPSSTSLASAPAISALFIALYEEIKDFPACASAIDTTIQYYTKSATTKDNAVLSQLRIKSATIKASAGDYQGAVDALEQLSTQCNKTTPTGLDSYYHYISQIVTLCTQHLPNKTEQYAAMLPDPDLSDINLSTLLSTPIEVNVTTTSSSRQPTASTVANGGKPKYSAEKLAKVRQRKKEALFKRKGPLLPKAVTLEQYLQAKADGFSKVDQYRWKPKWERPQVQQRGKKGQNVKQLSRGPQGSGISENKLETSTIPDTSKATDTKEKVQQHFRNQKQKKGGR